MTTGHMVQIIAWIGAAIVLVLIIVRRRKRNA